MPATILVHPYFMVSTMFLVVLSGATNAEAQVVVPVVRVVVVPVANRRVVSVVVPATTAFNAVRARRGAGL